MTLVTVDETEPLLQTASSTPRKPKRWLWIFPLVLIALLVFFIKPRNGPPQTTWSDIRLPPWILPVTYDLEIDTKLSTFSFEGSVSITLDIQQPTLFIVVHQLELNLTDVSLESNSVDHIDNIKDKEYVVIYFKHAISTGRHVLAVKFAGNLNRNMEGFYLSEFPSDEGTQYLATTQFEPVNARRAFPCLDEPDKKATFNIRIITPKSHHALSNMPVESVSDYQGKTLYRFKPTLKMSTYLVAYIVSNFEGISGTTKNNINITIYTRPKATQLGEYALKTAIHVMDYYQSQYKIPFPLPKCDFIAIPDFAAGAMENWGLITFRDTALLFDPSKSDSANKQRVATVIAHELAHQWFGNLVTMKWWSDLWLNEGFAEFMEYKGVDSAEPEWQMKHQFVSKDLIRALNADESLFTHSIAIPVQDPLEIQDIFDDISYGKGSSILRMLEAWIDENYGPNQFFVRLHDYLLSHAYSNAETSELWAALASPTQNVSRFMSTWTNQPGFPRVSVVTKKDTIEFTQERFNLATLVNITQGLNLSEIPLMNRPVDSTNQLWAVPLTWTFLKKTDKIQRSKVYSAEFYSKQKTIKKEQDGIVFVNIGHSGVYRVHYPDHVYTTISDWLVEDVEFLTPSERAGLISDVFALCFTGHVNITTALDFIKFLEFDMNPVVWETALSELKNFKKSFVLHPVFGRILKFQNQLMSNVIQKIGWKDTKEDALRSMLRNVLLLEAVRTGEKNIVKKALENFRLVKKGQAFNIETLGAIYTAGVRYGDEADYDWVLDQYLKSDFAPQQIRLIDALASTTTPHLQSKTLHLAFSGQIRLQDINTVFEKVNSNTPMGSSVVWTFFMDHWEKITSQKGHAFSKFNDLVEHVVTRLTRTALIKQVEDIFIHKSTNLYVPPNSVVSAVKGLEKAKQLHEWSALVVEDVVRWLDNKGF